MDSGFFSGSILDYLEQKHLHYIIACRFNNRIKYSLTHEKVWTEVAEGMEIAETTYQAEGWEKPRRIVMVRSLKTRRSFLSIWEKLKDFSLPYSTEKS